MTQTQKTKMFLAIAGVALILKDAEGKDFRVPQGETVELSEAQYKEVSAYVTLVEPDAETAQALAESASDAKEAESPPAEDKVAEAAEAKPAGKTTAKAAAKAAE